MKAIIDLEKYRRTGSAIFIDRERAREIIELSGFMKYVQESDCEIEIIIPKAIRSIMPTFLEEFVRPAVKYLTPEVFNKRVKFISEGEYNITEELEWAVNSSIRTKTALDL